MNRWPKSILSCLLSISLLSISPIYCGAQDERFRNYESLNPADDFTLTDQDKNPFHLKDHRGKLVLLFFGYLSCPDVCPVTLSKLSRVYDLMEANRDDVLTVYISVDHYRDTPEEIKEYLSYFDVNAVGLTGTEDEINEVVVAYDATYEMVMTKSALGYLINHTSYIYLIGPDGNVKYLFRPEDKAEHIAKTINKVYKDQEN